MKTTIYDQQADDAVFFLARLWEVMCAHPVLSSIWLGTVLACFMVLLLDTRSYNVEDDDAYDR